MSEEEKKLEERKMMNAPFIRAFEWYRTKHHLTQKKMCELLRCHSPLISDYKNGKEKAFFALVGSVMKESNKRADAIKTEKLLKRIIFDNLPIL